MYVLINIIIEIDKMKLGLYIIMFLSAVSSCSSSSPEGGNTGGTPLPTNPTTPTTPLTDTEALDLVQKMLLNISGIMQIRNQNWREKDTLRKILILSQILLLQEVLVLV